MLRLRPLEAGDCDMVRDWRNRPHVAAMMYTDHQIAPGEHARWFAATLIDPGKRYFIIEIDGAPGGLAGFTEIDHKEASASWAFYLADEQTRGRGLGAETEFLMLEHAFGALALETLRCEVLALNPAVTALHESFGFSRAGGRTITKNGAPLDVVMLAISAADWRRRRASAQARLEAKRNAPLSARR
jgi:UDP-4-amino-4,6-dideoxy-N-acetyl-beta-L-altrosamine N-acetyltransferase